MYSVGGGLVRWATRMYPCTCGSALPKQAKFSFRSAGPPGRSAFSKMEPGDHNNTAFAKLPW